MERDLHGATQDVKKIQHQQRRPKRQAVPQNEKTRRNCEKNYPHARGAESCPALGRKCYVCQRQNHFAKFCPKKGNTPEHGQQKTKFVNEIDENVVHDNNDYVFMVNGHVAKPPKFNVQFDECLITMIADSGANSTTPNLRNAVQTS